MYFVLWLGLINIIHCKFSEKHKENSLERNSANQQLGENKMELEILNSNTTTFHVKQFECFNISVAVYDNGHTGNNSNVEVRVSYRYVVWYGLSFI